MDDFGYQKTSKKLTAKINYRRYLVLILLIISIAGFLVIAGEAYYLSIFKDNKKVITILPPSGPLKVANNQQHNELENVNTSAVYEEIFGDRKVDEEIGKTVVITQPEPPSPAKNIPLTEGYLAKEDDLEQQIGYTETVSKTTNNNLKITNISAKEIIDPKKDNKPNNKDITKNSSKNPEKDNEKHSEKHDSRNLEPAISKLENKVKDQSLLFHLNQPPSKSQIITPILQHNKKDEKGEKGEKNQSGQNEETVKLKQQSKKDEDLEESKKNLLVPKNNSGGIIIFNEQNKAKNKEILILDNRNQKPIKSQQNQKEDLQNKQNDKKSKRMMVQIAAMSSKSNTEKMWKQISKNNPKFFKGLSYKIEEVNLGSKGLFYRLKVGSFANQIEAEKFCNKYLASSNKKSNSDCLMVE